MRFPFLLIGAIGAACPATAGDSWPFSVSGAVSGGASGVIPDAEAFLFGDATVHLGFGGTAFGIEVGVLGYVNRLDSPHETYGALTWDLSEQSRLSVGVPRPAYDSFAVSQLELAFPVLGTEFARRSRSEATWGAMFDGYLPLGARFESSHGPWAYAVSAHDASGITIASVGASGQHGDWLLSGAVEQSWSSAHDASAKLQALWTGDAISLGVGYYAPGAVGQPDFAEVFAAWQPSDPVTLTAILQAPFDGSEPTFGLSGAYEFRDDLALSVGAVSVNSAAPDFNVFLRYRF